MWKQFYLKRPGSGSYYIRCIDFPGGQACKRFALRLHPGYLFRPVIPNGQNSDTIVLFGAGATKACGGPLTNEILAQAFEPAVRVEIEREYYLDLLDRFLIENFHLPQQQADRIKSDYPAVPLLLSLVDTAIDRKQPMGATWSVELLAQVRRALQYVIFALLEYKLRRLRHNYYSDLLAAIDPQRTAPPTVISLNYDIIVDNAFVERYDFLPEYGCDITTNRYLDKPHKGRLLKIHGSLNWSYCSRLRSVGSRCRRIRSDI